MTRAEFLKALSAALSQLSRQERERSLAYYDEMISDRLEDGETEEQIMSEMESVDDIAQRIIADAASRNALRPEGRPFSTAMIIIGSPLWLAIAAVLFSVTLVVYVVVWCVIITLFAVLAALAAGALAGVAGLFYCLSASLPTALFLLGAGLVCAGLGMLILFPCISAAKALAKGTGKVCAKLWRGSVGKLKGRNKA